jgi:hypothetical protein
MADFGANAAKISAKNAQIRAALVLKTPFWAV